jgi:hypothetical protein
MNTAELFVFMEDDLDFNRSIRFNLEHWRPILEHPAGDDFFASLYNPNIAPVMSASDPDPYVIVDPEKIYGTQAVVLSVSLARWILSRWDDVRGATDIRMSRLAAQRTAIYYHRPSLVRHLAVPSTWGGIVHDAIDFSPDWRAES